MPTPNQENLDRLVEALNQVLPPPHTAPDNTIVIPGTGRWVLTRVGGGQYAVRIRYSTPTGAELVVRPRNEVRGYPSVVQTALRFTITTAAPGRYEWVAV